MSTIILIVTDQTNSPARCSQSVHESREGFADAIWESSRNPNFPTLFICVPVQTIVQFRFSELFLGLRLSLEIYLIFYFSATPFGFHIAFLHSLHKANYANLCSTHALLCLAFHIAPLYVHTITYVKFLCIVLYLTKLPSLQP